MNCEKVELTDRQHQEMLLFTKVTLQDIREKKLTQRWGIIGVLSLMGAMIAIAEKKNPLECPLQTVLIILTILAGFYGIRYVIWQQKGIVRFRKRLKALYNNHFALNLKPIIGRESIYEDDPKSLSCFGDEVIFWIVLIVAAVVFSCFWYIISAYPVI